MKQLWILLLLIPTVLANTIETSQTAITIEDNTATVNSNIILQATETIGNITLILAPQSRNAVITIDGKKTTCDYLAEFARCGQIEKGPHIINISYATNYPIAISGENTIIRYTNRLPYPSERQSVTLQLPIGYIIPREKGKDDSFYISPTPKEVYSDGQSIILHWEQKGQEMPISVISRKVISEPIGWMIATTLSMILSAALSIWLVLHKKKEPKVKIIRKPAKKEVTPSLIDNEQKVVNFLKETGEVWQKQIQQATGFSKAKVSRVIRNLEARGVVNKVPYGNTNKISLKK